MVTGLQVTECSLEFGSLEYAQRLWSGYFWWIRRHKFTQFGHKLSHKFVAMLVNNLNIKGGEGNILGESPHGQTLERANVPLANLDKPP